MAFSEKHDIQLLTHADPKGRNSKLQHVENWDAYYLVTEITLLEIILNSCIHLIAITLS